MNILIVVVLLVLAGAALWYFNRPASVVVAPPITAGSSAFARLADHDGKIIALKAATENQLAAAKERHVALDEVSYLL